MTKHLADHRTLPTGKRFQRFVEIHKLGAEEQVPPPFALARYADRQQTNPRRLIEYLRIERGRLA